MEPDDVPSSFDPDDVEAVAADHEIEPHRLASILRAHQNSVADLPGVENLVYEWRKQFGATVLAQSATAYYVAAPEWIWREFADHLDADEREMEVLAALHERTVSENAEVADGTLSNAAACVLVRP